MPPLSWELLLCGVKSIGAGLITLHGFSPTTGLLAFYKNSQDSVYCECFMYCANALSIIDEINSTKQVIFLFFINPGA